jgi:hypothetical protein
VRPAHAGARAVKGHRRQGAGETQSMGEAAELICLREWLGEGYPKTIRGDATAAPSWREPVASLASCVGRPHVWRTTTVADKAGSTVALDAGRMVDPLPITRKRLNGASEFQRAHTRRIRIHCAGGCERAQLILCNPSGRRRGGRGDRRRLPALGPLARAALSHRFRHALALKLSLRRGRVLGKPVPTGCGCVVDES